MKTAPVPVYCIDSYPEGHGHDAFHAQRLETVIAGFSGIDKAHTHDFYLLLYVTAGTGTHTVDFITYAVHPGSLFLLAPGQMHSWNLSADCQGYLLFFEAGFYLQRYPSSRLHEYPFFKPLHSPVVELPAGAGTFPVLLEHVLQEAESPFDNRLEVLRACLYVLLEMAARYARAEPAGSSPRQVQQLHQFEELLEQHFRTKKTVQTYAQWLNLTPNHLNALCRRHRGHTASDLIQQRVVVEAQRLLVHSRQPVKQIAAELGFQDASYFGRFFRKRTGLTPDQFRENR
ncbi:helix-turn-helix domain-containing protein [Hymenobacter jeollabukensis]|uniref:Helix-turn-helix domain-containing protein n=1 Tax=Hymenobacter jeollabukensis TaxID=2025313 RepID=A0A5R8WHX2_9BACT|nr:helix-turn-helix domain-containing protein [Hymenobacter jeollabukensis]TLM87823.1 helix-turn-helix domain-containing protein [Hymenobacter jeollabukensis]